MSILKEGQQNKTIENDAKATDGRVSYPDPL